MGGPWEVVPGCRPWNRFDVSRVFAVAGRYVPECSPGRLRGAADPRQIYVQIRCLPVSCVL